MNNEVDIERWLKQEMNEAERTAFEQKMAIDPELQQRTALHRQFMEDLQEIGLKHKVKIAAKANKRLLHSRRWVALLCIVFFFAIIALLWSRSVYKTSETIVPIEEGQQTPPRLDKELKPEKEGLKSEQSPTVPIAQGPASKDGPLFRNIEDSSLDSTMLPIFRSAFKNYTPIIDHKSRFSGALRLYEQGKWAETSKMLSPMMQNDTAKYLLALTAMQENQPEKALPYLTALYRADGLFRAESEWLMGLTMILQGKEELAAQVLGGIARKVQHPHREAAAQLLKSILD